MGGDGSFVPFLVVMLVVLFIQLWDGESSSVAHGLEDPNNRLSSWGREEDCCQWEGVGCNNRTGHVERLDLSKSLGGKLSPSLLNLTHLNYLNLSYNDFSGTRIPSFIGSFKMLRYLDLTDAGFSGVVPPHLGNLSTLHHLSLSRNNVEIDDAEWLSRLTSLQLIHMDSVSFAGKASHNWAQALNKIPSLVEISLRFCHKLYSAPLSLAHVNLTSLAFLDLSDNSFNSTIPEWIFNLTKLVHLDLSLNAFHGSIPAALVALTTLEFLDLSLNTLEGPWLSGSLPDSLGENNLKATTPANSGPIPTSIGRLRHLQTLKLFFNHINGSVPESIGRLSYLIELDLAWNNLEGVLSDAFFANLKGLKILSISGNLMNVSSDWDPPFRLEEIYMASCRLGPRFPTQEFLIQYRIGSGIYLHELG